MRIAIFADMEGISGISGSTFVRMDERCYARGQRFLTWDVNACAQGCFEAGATSVLVYDGHATGNNLLWDELDPRVELIQGDRGPHRLVGIDNVSGLILLGYHARAGVAGALLEHTYSSAAIQNMWLNGRLAGEIAFDAGVAADAGVPTIMVSGDDKACAEAREWLPDVVTCEVKKGLSCQGAWHLPRREAHALITQKTHEAIARLDAMPLMQIDRPVTVRVEYVERHAAPHEFRRPNLRVLDARTVEATADTMDAALMQVLG